MWNSKLLKIEALHSVAAVEGFINKIKEINLYCYDVNASKRIQMLFNEN